MKGVARGVKTLIGGHGLLNITLVPLADVCSIIASLFQNFGQGDLICTKPRSLWRHDLGLQHMAGEVPAYSNLGSGKDCPAVHWVGKTWENTNSMSKGSPEAQKVSTLTP